MTTLNRAQNWNAPRSAAVGGLLLIWLAAAYAIGSGGLLANQQQSVLAPIALSAFGPVALFLLAYRMSARFRGLVLAQDLKTLTSLQHWRVIGFVFLPLYFFGVLPGLFAWPAGLGDLAIGLATPFIVARLARNPEFAASRGFLRFNLLGLFDFAVAITTAGLTAGAIPELAAGGPSSAALDLWPLNLFPSFIVPIFIILHLAVLLKIRHLRLTAKAET